MATLEELTTDLARVEQEHSDLLAEHNARIITADDTAVLALERANNALTDVGDIEFRVNLYTDTSVAALDTALRAEISSTQTLLSNQISSEVSTQIDTILPNLTADIDAALLAMNDTEQQINLSKIAIENAVQGVFDDVMPRLAQAQDLLNVRLPDIEQQVSDLLTDYSYTSLLQGFDDVRAENEANLVPLSGGILREPRSRWTDKSPNTSSTLTKAAITGGSFVTDHASFGEAYVFPELVNKTLGPAHPVDFDPQRIYKIKVRCRLEGAANTGDVSLGVTTQKGTTLVEVNVQADSTTLSILDGDQELEVYVSGNITAMDDYGVLVNERIELNPALDANKIYFHIRQHANAQISVASIELYDITEVINNINALRIELQANIDGVSATLNQDYYTAVDTDAAIAASTLNLKSEMESPTGSIGLLEADLSNNYYTTTQTDGEISTAVAAARTTLSSKITQTGLVEDFTDVDGWVGNWLYDKDERINAQDPVAKFTEIDHVYVAGEGHVLQCAAQYRVISERYMRPFVKAQTWRLRIRTRMTVDATDFHMKVWIVTCDSSGTYTGYDYVTEYNDLLVSDGWTELVLEFTPATLNRYLTGGATEWCLMFGIMGNGGTAGPGVQQISKITLTDVSAASDVAADLELNYFTSAETDTAIAGAITTAKAEIEDPNGSSVGATLASGYFTKAEVNSAIAASSVTLSADIAANTADIDDLLALDVSPEHAFATFMTELDVAADGTVAGITNFGAAMADIHGNAQSAYVLKAVAGEATGTMELVAWDDASGSGSAIKLNADYVIAPGTLSATRMVLTDLGNMHPDQDYHDPDAWGGSGNSILPTTEPLWESANVLSISGSASSYVYAYGPLFPVTAGTELYMEATSQVYAGSGTLNANLQFFANADYQNPVNVWDASAGFSQTSTAITKNNGTFNVPSGKRYARVRLYKLDDGITEARFGRISVRQRRGGELLLDGSMYAHHIAAGAVETSKLSIGAGGNILEDTGFASGVDRFKQVTNTISASIQLRGAGSNWAGAGYPTVEIVQNNGTSTGDVTYTMQRIGATGSHTTQGYPAVAGKWYEIHAHASTHRCYGSIAIVFRDSSNAWISASYLSFDTDNPGDQNNPDAWKHYWKKVQAPAGTAVIQFRVIKFATTSGEANSYLFLHKPYMGETHADATEATPFSSGGMTDISGDQITTGAIKSANYSAGSIGWSIDHDGSAEFNNLVVRGWMSGNAASDGGEAVASNEARYANSTAILTYATGPVSLGQVWQIGTYCEYRRNQFYSTYNSNTSEYTIYYVESRYWVRVRTKSGGVWGSWENEWQSAAWSDGTGWVADDYIFHKMGEYEDMEIQIYAQATVRDTLVQFTNPGPDTTYNNYRKRMIYARALEV